VCGSDYHGITSRIREGISTGWDPRHASARTTAVQGGILIRALSLRQLKRKVPRMAVAIDDNGKLTEYVRNPDGSWTGWGKAVGVPIEVAPDESAPDDSQRRDS